MPHLTLHHPSRARAYYERGLWRDDTFYALLAQRAAERPEAPALRDGRVDLTWRQVLERVEGVAAAYDELGLAPGERVSIWMANRVEAIIAFLACSRQGLACNPSLHRTHTCAEVATLLRRLDTRLLLTQPGWGADDDRDALADLPGLRATWTPADFPPPRSAPAEPKASDPDRVVYLAFTSGTTGEPKCVMHSDNTLLANARDLVADWKHGPDTVLLTLSPLSHHIAWVAVAQWLLTGCRLVTDDPPQGMSRLEWLVDCRATYVMGVPTHAMDMLAAQRKAGLDRLGEVSIFYMAGSSIPPSLAAAFVEQGITPQNVYGMTENSSHQYTHPSDPTAIVVSTCGRGGPAYEVRIFDTDDPDREVARGRVGEIGGRGAALMLGYFGNQAASERSFNRSGWFMSGDLGSLDEAGNLKIEGRLRELIIRGGNNIYPARIESLAVRHPLVDKAACFPVADARLGERVCIAVTGGDIDGPALLGHLAAEGLSKYDMPEWFIRLDSFPLTASGKILKRRLAEDVENATLSPIPMGAKTEAA